MRRRLLLALPLGLALLLPMPALAATNDAVPDTTTPAFDTPAPRPVPDTGPSVERTPRPQQSPGPTEAPAAPEFAITPGRDKLSVGYAGSQVVRQAPLLIAELAGYFDDAGFERVTVSASPNVLRDVASGDLDIAVVGTAEAAAAVRNDPRLRAIAGYRNYPRGTYGGDVLVAAPGLVDSEPATMVAFLVAYIRALQDLSEPEAALDALALLQTTDLAISDDLAARWPEEVAAFAPFDGGFGSVEEGGGLGELEAYLAETEGPEPPLGAFIAQPALNSAQAWSGLGPNPAGDFSGPPGLVDLAIGLPMPDGLISPIVTANYAGYFTDAGFSTVELVDVDQPLLGVLQGLLDFGVMDALDVAEAVDQGLPLVTVAGHRNYASDGTYGGDVLVASTDMLSEEGSTVTAFLTAVIRGLADLREETTLAPHDGGFGDREQGGGLDELRSYLTAATGAEPDLDAMVESGPLEYAQARWGLPANPANPAEDG